MTCTHCLNAFAPSADSEGNPVFADDAGAICCKICYCECCGHGHPTDEEKLSCEANNGDPERSVLPTWPALAVV